MRRYKQEIPLSEVKEILKSATNGVLSLLDKENRPYGVPMSFVYDGERAIYFHSAREGRKIQCIENNCHACFTVVAMDDIHPYEFTTYFKSAIVEGEISAVTERDNIREILRILSDKYSPGIESKHEIEKSIDRVLILKLIIGSMSGKEAKELANKRNNQL